MLMRLENGSNATILHERRPGSMSTASTRTPRRSNALRSDWSITGSPASLRVAVPLTTPPRGSPDSRTLATRVARSTSTSARTPNRDPVNRRGPALAHDQAHGGAHDAKDAHPGRGVVARCSALPGLRVDTALRTRPTAMEQSQQRAATVLAIRERMQRHGVKVTEQEAVQVALAAGTRCAEDLLGFLFNKLLARKAAALGGTGAITNDEFGQLFGRERVPLATAG